MAARAPKKAGMSEETKKNIREGIVAVLIAFVVMGACSLLFIGHQNAPVPQPETANAVVAAATVNGPTFLEKAASILAVGVFFVSVLIFLPLCVFLCVRDNLVTILTFLIVVGFLFGWIFVLIGGFAVAGAMVAKK